ncbi:MAG: RHS repeat-associated core domain-containing protein [Chryseobacterium jejuense]|uniref:RHS repeat-associated core domain-containing protein n=1 Tax=Chryseobacterium jejuense TaxID=445960 RepID=UPI003D0B2267
MYQGKDHLGNKRVNFAKNSAGVLEVTDTNNYYPFGLNHIGNSFLSSLGSYNAYKYNGKEVQETGMYDYGARMYMPDLGRWGVVDAAAEIMRRYSPYNYAFNNPVNFIDPDGNTPRGTYGEHSAFNGDYDPNTSLSGYNGMGGSHGMYFANNDGGGFGSAQKESGSITGDYSLLNDLISMWEARGIQASISPSGYLTYWTGSSTQNSYRKDGELHVDADLGIMHRIALNNTPVDAYKNWADWGATTIGGGFDYVAKRRTALYNNGYWIDNLGQMRSIAYAGRARGSLIGLRSDYVRATEMYGKYAKRASYVGYAISAGQIGYGAYQDGWKVGVKTQVATANVAGGMAGAAIGAWAIGKLGGMIGTLIGPEGTVGGAVIGGVVGGIVGGVWGGDIAEGWADEILNKPDNIK